MAIYDEPGRGRKKCQCGKYVGVFSKACPACNHVFSDSDPKTKEEPKPKVVVPKAPVFYEEGGKGRKQCKCGKYVFAAATDCPACHKPFEPLNPVEAKVPVFYEEGGKGRKQCKCGKYVGGRVSICPACNYSFEQTGKKVPLGTHAPEELSPVHEKAPLSVSTPVFREPVDILTRQVIAPAGKCPVVLESVNPEEVTGWCQQVMSICRQRGQKLSYEAVCHYARQFFTFHSEAYQQIISILRTPTLFS